jgi:phenylpropionate dioxygenase-like ring-hydroxylating dioxygenase large terminal subunit
VSAQEIDRGGSPEHVRHATVRAAPPDVSAMVQPARVHRAAYTDPAIFELEMERIFDRVWTYVGHETQVPNPGDYWTVQIGRQPMIMSRHTDGRVYVLYNRCPHRGTMIAADRNGRNDKGFICSYHAWQFHCDGKSKAVPLAHGYEGTEWRPGGPECDLKRAPRVASYRGFYFASLAADGPSLEEWLGPARIGLDDIVERAPAGEIELVPTCFRVVQRSNWKFFLENQLDVAHAVVTHEAAGRAAVDVGEDIKRRGGSVPFDYHLISVFTSPLGAWEKMTTVSYPSGHSVLQGTYNVRPQDPDSLAYEGLMRESYGRERAEEILGRNIHHVIVYPGLSLQPPFQQLRAIRPLSVDRTLVEIWHFRLKGAPEAIYNRALGYYNLVNSPSTIINADDLWNFWKGHQGLASDGGDWSNMHRWYGTDQLRQDGGLASTMGTSEAPLRNMFTAWRGYMADGAP